MKTNNSLFQSIKDSLEWKEIPHEILLQMSKDCDKLVKRIEHFIPEEYRGLSDEQIAALSEEELEDYENCILKAELRAMGDPGNGEGCYLTDGVYI